MTLYAAHMISSGPADRDFVMAVRRALDEHADPERATSQQRYMKSAMPYRGLTSPVLKAALRPILAAHLPPDRATWQSTVRALWDEATYREEWYAALALARHRRARAWRDGSSMPLWRHLVETGAWWDVVDEVAHIVGEVLDSDPAGQAQRLRGWAREQHLWIRRVAIISQLGRRDRVDLDLLADCVTPNLGDREFFIRKAIGWALRDAARTHPDWVRTYVDGHPDMAGLTRREALRRLA